MLKTVAHGMMALKDRGVTSMEAQLLRESFEEKLNDIAKNKEIFDQTQGQMAEKINELQVELTKMQKEIREQILLIKL
uniref:Putative salivary protein of the 35 kDa family n=1 Tax=Aedes aegypti TaxID=7159 RepID=Q1HRS8_AEDAE|nr:putative salivary protein of the 35 kDa family [Aedes aegypti]